MVSGSDSGFESQFAISGPPGFTAQSVKDSVQQFILRNGIVRVYGNQNFLCIFVRRQENAIPGVADLRSRIDTILKFFRNFGNDPLPLREK